MIKAFLGAVAMLLAAGGGAVDPAIRAVSATPARSFSTSPAAEGTSSTPGAFPLPQLGSAEVACNRRWAMQPFFDLGTVATEEVTIRAGAITRRNFVTKVVGRVGGRPVLEQVVSRAERLALPFGYYRSVSFTVRQDTEPHEIVARVRAALVDGAFAVPGMRGRLGDCYVKRWSVRMDVRPN